jgi:hypothetical protein
MRRLPRAKVALVLLSGATVASVLAATPALAAGLPSTVDGTSSATAWTYYATYPDYASCAAAARAQGRNWQCVMSSPSGAHDLYLWF